MAGREERLRAVGRRLPFDAVPEAVRAGVGGVVGEVAVFGEHRGGMSPGCATSLRTADGGLVFVKAVGAGQNPQTVELFRYETGILRQLPPAPYRPGLLAAYDEDGWGALLLEHIDGRHPDLGDPRDLRAAAGLVGAQVAELTPPPAAGVPGMERPPTGPTRPPLPRRVLRGGREPPPHRGQGLVLARHCPLRT